MHDVHQEMDVIVTFLINIKAVASLGFKELTFSKLILQLADFPQIARKIINSKLGPERAKKVEQVFVQ